jgi:glycosyltransferase involved in cell wall biosynthesis
MLKLFHFILDHRIGGPHVYVRSLAKILGESVESNVVTTGRGEMTDIALINLRHRLRILYPFEVIVNVLLLLWLFRKSLARRNCVFDVHGVANLAPIIAARLLQLPIVWHLHETMESMKKLAWFGKLLTFRSVHCKVAVSKKSTEVYQTDDAEVVYAPIDATYWRISEEEREARTQSSKLRLVSVGNLNPLKGMDVLLDSVSGLDTPWELVIIGSELSTHGEHTKLLHEKARIAEQGSGNVRFVGWQPSDSVREFLACADVFVLASHSEAGPIALLEAMAMECACIITDVGDAREIIEQGETGVVINEPDSFQLLEAIREMHLLGSTRRQEMGRRARARVTAINSCEIVAERHLEIYSALLRPISSS